MTATEIIPNLWVGDLTAAHFWQGPKLCVREAPADVLFESLNDLSITWQYGKLNAAGVAKLSEACQWIDDYLALGNSVLVHCSSGMHRSPFVIAYWMHTRLGVTMDEAYKHIIARRPVVERRDHWLPNSTAMPTSSVVSHE